MKNVRTPLRQAAACGIAAWGTVASTSAANAETVFAVSQPAVVGPNISAAAMVACPAHVAQAPIRAKPLIENVRTQKSAAILGGEMSALELMRTQQNGQVPQVAQGLANPVLNSLAPAAGNVRQYTPVCQISTQAFTNAIGPITSKPSYDKPSYESLALSPSVAFQDGRIGVSTTSASFAKVATTERAPDNLTVAAMASVERQGIAVLTSNVALIASAQDMPLIESRPSFAVPFATVGMANVALPKPSQPTSAMPLDPKQFLASRRVKIGKTNLDHQWHRVRSESVQRVFRREFGRKARPSIDLIEQVNSWVNRKISYVEDRNLFAKADHWAGARRTLILGKGDCEDYALTKMQLLAAAGIDRNDMFLTIAKDRVRNADHALLVVRFEGRYVVLDNATDQLMDGALSHDYTPVLSFNSQSAWIHGY